jgi:hypothetical protein
MKSLISAAAILATAFATPANAADSAKYAVDAKATWTAKPHPLEYPAEAHFSGLIGATHNA